MSGELKILREAIQETLDNRQVSLSNSIEAELDVIGEELNNLLGDEVLLEDEGGGADGISDGSEERQHKSAFSMRDLIALAGPVASVVPGGMLAVLGAGLVGFGAYKLYAWAKDSTGRLSALKMRQAKLAVDMKNVTSDNAKNEIQQKIKKNEERMQKLLQKIKYAEEVAREKAKLEKEAEARRK